MKTNDRQLSDSNQLKDADRKGRKMVLDEIKSKMKYIEEVTRTLGYAITDEDYYINDMGCPHVKPKFVDGYIAIYIFVYEKDQDNFEFLKIGKANSKSKARFTSQHYGFNARSTLARSICSDDEFVSMGIGPDNVKTWMMNNLHRINIFIKADKGKATTELVEAVFHYAFRPRYEGNI
jgi:hypothetical protein